MSAAAAGGNGQGHRLPSQISHHPPQYRQPTDKPHPNQMIRSSGVSDQNEFVPFIPPSATGLNFKQHTPLLSSSNAVSDNLPVNSRFVSRNPVSAINKLPVATPQSMMPNNNRLSRLDEGESATVNAKEAGENTLRQNFARLQPNPPLNSFHLIAVTSSSSPSMPSNDALGNLLVSPFRAKLANPGPPPVPLHQQVRIGNSVLNGGGHGVSNVPVSGTNQSDELNGVSNPLAASSRHQHIVAPKFPSARPTSQPVPHLDLRKPPLESALPHSIISSANAVVSQTKLSNNVSIPSPVNRSSGAAMAFAATTTTTTATSGAFNPNFMRQSVASHLTSGLNNRSPVHHASSVNENARSRSNNAMISSVTTNTSTTTTNTSVVATSVNNNSKVHSDQPELRSHSSRLVSSHLNSSIMPQKLHHPHPLHHQQQAHHISGGSKKAEISRLEELDQLAAQLTNLGAISPGPHRQNNANQLNEKLDVKKSSEKHQEAYEYNANLAKSSDESVASGDQFIAMNDVNDPILPHYLHHLLPHPLYHLKVAVVI
ncbi:unnamed protein product [Heterobilharzia americana]|nr:unnamed protein product [Heterobilharzia americana]